MSVLDVPAGVGLTTLAVLLGAIVTWRLASLVSSPVWKYPGPLLASKSIVIQPMAPKYHLTETMEKNAPGFGI